VSVVRVGDGCQEEKSPALGGPLNPKTTASRNRAACRPRRTLPPTDLNPNKQKNSQMYDLVCFSHLRWDFVFQRPQHLLSRCGRERRVFFIEEPLYVDGLSYMRVKDGGPGVHVLTPMLTRGLTSRQVEFVTTELVNEAFMMHDIDQYVLWFYTPMAVPLARKLSPVSVVYDCMDELSMFMGAPPELLLRERELFALADLVLTGGHALYEAKCAQHPNVHSFPSSVDVPHFAQARRHVAPPPADQARIPGPRFGFCGVVDERMDLALLEGVARARPTWQLVVLGPVVKINEADLPRLPNLHYLGSKTYEELPAYLSGWDVALMPFAKNDATRFISPTKTPEYLAAGKPVVSTSIRDVVRTYGEAGLCHIADGAEAFVAACERALLEKDSELRIRKADEFLTRLSWDDTWKKMAALVADAVQSRRGRSGTFSRSLPTQGLRRDRSQSK
jgi:glycosyltransferase involved in cell wall biosynthesis